MGQVESPSRTLFPVGFYQLAKTDKMMIGRVCLSDKYDHIQAILHRFGVTEVLKHEHCN